jgi:hypothetical protein
MKTNTFKIIGIPFIIFASLFLSSCDEDTQKPSGTGTAAKEKAEKVLALRDDLSFINRFVDTNVVIPDSETGRASFVKATVARISESAPCADATEEELPDGSLKITLDFGEGCATEEGVEVAGTVVMIFHVAETTFQFGVEFLNYTELSGEHEGDVVNGTVDGSFLFDLEASTFVQEMEQDLAIEYADETEAAYKITQKAEMTETGMRVTVLTTSGNLADGGYFATTLSKSMVYDFSCDGDFPVRGEELLTFQGNTILVNYGNGSCDDNYTVK